MTTVENGAVRAIMRSATVAQLPIAVVDELLESASADWRRVTRSIINAFTACTTVEACIMARKALFSTVIMTFYKGVRVRSEI